MSITEQAEMFARGAHAGQKHGDRPYWTHLRDVAKLTVSWGLGSPNIVCAAWLHDTIEDTGVTYQHILELFGRSIAEIVWGVTDELGRNRRERKDKTYPKIFKSPECTAVKVADLYDNVKKSVASKDKYLQMYIREWSEIEYSFSKNVQSVKPSLVGVVREINNMILEVDH